MEKPKNQSPELKGIQMDIIITNPKRKSTHKAPCVFPLDILDMDQEMITKAYGPHIIKAVYDLVQHPSFRQGIAKPKLILAND